ncbi:MAG: hypothetical protein N4A76_05830 [Firmicutes bacterium]|jgi:hypothetical protein|nr:hypothetical protein [Bacillota bacterium]
MRWLEIIIYSFIALNAYDISKTLIRFNKIRKAQSIEGIDYYNHSAKYLKISGYVTLLLEGAMLGYAIVTANFLYLMAAVILIIGSASMIIKAYTKTKLCEDGVYNPDFVLLYTDIKNYEFHPGKNPERLTVRFIRHSSKNSKYLVIDKKDRQIVEKVLKNHVVRENKKSKKKKR